MQQNQEVLRMENITKSFPGVKALQDVSLTVRRGTVHALMGENGAGKSTLMKCLFGVYKKDGGKIYVDGNEVEFRNSATALKNGVAMVHQELNQALKRNVSENMWMGRLPVWSRFFPVIKEKKMHHDTKEILSQLNIRVDPKTVMSKLPVSVRQMVEIAKAVSYDAKIIVFDEPTSSLTEKEVEHLFSIIDMLKKKGCGIIYISHKMEEILKISDDITVMRDGRHVATKPANELTMEEIIRLMVGRELTERYPVFPDRDLSETLLEVKHLSGMYNKLKDVSFTLKKGEILGVAGLDGSGRTELLETMYGLLTKKDGELFLSGKKIQNKSASDAIKNGFALLTEERRATGIFGILSVSDNTVISSLKRHSTGPFTNNRKIRESTRNIIKSMNVKTPSGKAKIRNLSGGNQQKVILGRWLLTNPSVLLLDEPTRGIDVGAKFEIYRLIGSLAEQGKGVIMVSSEMPELLGVCDRILVMSGGMLSGEVNPKNTSQEEILTLAAKYV